MCGSGSRLRHPCQSELRPEVCGAVYRTDAAGLSTKVEDKVIRPLEIFAIVNLKLPEKIRLQWIRNQRTRTQIDADFGLVPAGRNEVIRGTNTARQHWRLIVLSVDIDLGFRIQWHRHGELRAGAFRRTGRSLHRLRIQLNVTAVIRSECRYSWLGLLSRIRQSQHRLRRSRTAQGPDNVFGLRSFARNRASDHVKSVLQVDG